MKNFYFILIFLFFLNRSNSWDWKFWKWSLNSSSNQEPENPIKIFKKEIPTTPQPSIPNLKTVTNVSAFEESSSIKIEPKAIQTLPQQTPASPIPAKVEEKKEQVIEPIKDKNEYNQVEIMKKESLKNSIRENFATLTSKVGQKFTKSILIGCKKQVVIFLKNQFLSQEQKELFSIKNWLMKQAIDALENYDIDSPDVGDYFDKSSTEIISKAMDYFGYQLTQVFSGGRRLENLNGFKSSSFFF